MSMPHWADLLVGVAIGATAATVVRVLLNRVSGRLLIDRTNPEKDVYRIELDELDTLANKKRVVLVVDPNACLSQD